MATVPRENELNTLLHTLREPKSVISWDHSSEAFLASNEELMEYLKKVEEFHGIEEADNGKDRVIKEFESLVHEWMAEVNRKREQTGSAKVVLYGSKASRTSLKSDDIDILILTPRYVDRQADFFGDFFRLLQSNKRVTCLLAISRAIVPIIKCDFEDCRLDIGFITGEFDANENNSDVLYSDAFLATMDENMVRSFNAFRNAHLVYKSIASGIPGELLPLEVRLQNYRFALLCIKLWAKRKGCYGSMLGYFGGISLAIMVAKICQMYPNMCAAQLIERFFFISLIHQEIPIMVEPLKSNPELDQVSKGKYFRMEDLTMNKLAKRIMYVVSPAFPPMNTTYNVSESQLKIIEGQLTEAFKTTRIILQRELDWSDLFIALPFFHDFDFFLEIEILSKDEDSFYKWRGLIQARLRYLLLSFDQDVQEKVSFQLWPQDFNVYFSKQPEYKYACYYYIGVKSYSNQPEVVNLTNIVKTWKKNVYEQWEHDSKDNLLFFITRRRNDLDTFVYNPVPKDFIQYDADRQIFPQDKEPSHLLSRLIPESSQMYMHNNLSIILNNMQTGGSQAQLQKLMYPQYFYNTGPEPTGGAERGGRMLFDEPPHNPN